MITDPVVAMVLPEPAAPVSRPQLADTSHLVVALSDIARELDERWVSACAEGDFVEIARLVDASHAVHRATVALHAESLVPTP